MNRMTALFLTLIFLLLFPLITGGQPHSPLLSCETVQRAQALPSLPAEAEEDWWTTVQETIQSEEYFITWQDRSPLPESKGAYQSPNRSQGFRTWFSEDGIHVTPRTRNECSWTWGLSLVDELEQFCEKWKPGITVFENRIELERGWVTEWYVNSPAGLEQGFTVHRAPIIADVGSSALESSEGQLRTDGRDEELRLFLRLSGSLHPKFAADGRAVTFWDGSTVNVLCYSHLKVTDATGRELAARLEGWVDCTGDVLPSSTVPQGGICIVIKSDGAVFPLTVDPLITSPAWTVESDQIKAKLGYSVGTAGDVDGDGYSDVIVGAPEFDAIRVDAGRAYLYRGSPSGLSLSAAWMVSGDQLGDNLGLSVGTAGDVNNDGYSDVIIGSPNYANGQTSEGQARLYLGSASGLSSTAAWTAESNQNVANFGWSVGTAGDVNGDGYSDVIIGSPNYANGQTNEGRTFLYLGSLSGLSPTESWTAESNQSGANFGWSVGTAGDVNGDGYADVIIGSPNYANGQTNEGRTFLYLGSFSGLSPTESWTAESNQSGAYFGWSVGTAGDVNGDGYSDVIIGARNFNNGQTNEGRAFLYCGSFSGLSLTESWTAESNQGSAYFGWSVGTAGDVNGDGYSDVIIGAYHYSSGETREGRAYLYLGSSSGLLATESWMAESDQAEAMFGFSVATAGDVNGDGYSDVIIGAWEYDNGEDDEGRAYLYCGSPSGLSSTSYWMVESDQEDALASFSVGTAGDVNGDGYADVIVGVPSYDNGEPGEGLASVYCGSSSGLSTIPAWTVESNQSAAEFGRSVGMAGDVNGDGYSDVIIGVPFYDNGENEEGRVYLYIGGPSGLSLTESWTAEGDQAGAAFGYAVGTAGDVNGDGYADVIIGAPSYDNGENEEGRVYLYLGGPTGLSSTESWTAESDQAEAEFGNALGTAGDVNSDGYSDVIIGAWLYDDVELNAGRTFLYLGGPSGLSSSPVWTAESDQENACFGWSVGTAGDVNGDGYSDVIISAVFYDLTFQDSGQVSLYLGGPLALSASPVWIEDIAQANARFGYSVGTAGDVNGDGFSDVLISAAYADNGQVDEGQVFLYFGSPSGLGTIPAWVSESDQANAIFGWSVGTAGDVNGDGYSDVIIGSPYFDNGDINEGRAYLYYGNAGAGFPIRPRQMRADLTASLSPLGAAIDQQFRIGLNVRSPFGRGRVKMQWQAVPLSESFYPLWNPICEDSLWRNSGIAGIQQMKLQILPDPPGPFKWRARVHYHPATCPFMQYGPWFTLAANSLHEADLHSLIAIPCVVPDEPCWICSEDKSVPDNFPILNWQDANQSNQYTGWNIRRSNNPAIPKNSWPIVASNIVDMDGGTPNYQWTDISGDDPGPGGVWFYQVTTYNANCPAEGPF